MNLSQMPEWLSASLSLLGLLAMIFGPTILAARLEKRMVWPYTPIDEPAPRSTHQVSFDENPYAVGRAVDSTIKVTPFSARENMAASLAGFDHVGAFKHGKG